MKIKTPLSLKNSGPYWDLFSQILFFNRHPTPIQRTGHAVRKLQALLDSISVHMDPLSPLCDSPLHLALGCTYSRTYRSPTGSFLNSAMLWVGSPSKSSSQSIENSIINYPTLGVLYVPSSRSLPTLDLRPPWLRVFTVTGRASGHLPLLGTQAVR